MSNENVKNVLYKRGTGSDRAEATVLVFLFFFSKMQEQGSWISLWQGRTVQTAPLRVKGTGLGTAA